MNLHLQKGSRSKVLSYVILSVMIIFVARLFYIQVIQHDYYKDLASSEQIKRLKIPAKRGLIYALNGSTPTKLVMNESVYTVFVDPEIVDDPDKIIDQIQLIAKDKARDGFESLVIKKNTRYQILAKKLTRSEADQIKAQKLKGLGFQEESQRVYPEGGLAAQVLGFVDYEGEGRYGVEDALNDRLVGIDGLLQSVTDVRDVPLTIGNQNIKIPKKDGDNIVLSLDRNIQSKVENALVDGLKRTGAQKGSVLVMDPNSGMVKAMANLPSYDPAKYSLVQDSSLFNNETISLQYEPGSVSKAFTVVKALNDGVITPETKFTNTDYVTIDDWTISNSTKGRTGVLTMQDAYNWSLNTGMIEIMKLFGGGSVTRDAKQKLYSFLHDSLGIGTNTGVELAGEVPGVMFSPDDSEGSAVRYATMSFGQGYQSTMIQIASAYSAIINGGNLYQPTVIAGSIDDEGNYLESKPRIKKTGIVSVEASSTIRQMSATARATLNPRDKAGYQVGGKTGTSQVADKGKYKDNETIGSYVGFGGSDSPKYVIIVMLSGKNQALAGARDAAPIFTDVSNWMIDYLKIEPKG